MTGPWLRLLRQTLGGKLPSIAVGDPFNGPFDVIVGGVLLLRRVCHSLADVLSGAEVSFAGADHVLGNSVGAIG